MLVPRVWQAWAQSLVQSHAPSDSRAAAVAQQAKDVVRIRVALEGVHERAGAGAGPGPDLDDVLARLPLAWEGAPQALRDAVRPDWGLAPE